MNDPLDPSYPVALVECDPPIYAQLRKEWDERKVTESRAMLTKATRILRKTLGWMSGHALMRTHEKAA